MVAAIPSAVWHLEPCHPAHEAFQESIHLVVGEWWQCYLLRFLQPQQFNVATAPPPLQVGFCHYHHYISGSMSGPDLALRLEVEHC